MLDNFHFFFSLSIIVHCTLVNQRENNLCACLCVEPLKKRKKNYFFSISGFSSLGYGKLGVGIFVIVCTVGMTKLCMGGGGKGKGIGKGEKRRKVEIRCCDIITVNFKLEIDFFSGIFLSS